MTSLSVGVTVVGLLILGQSEDPDAKVDLRTPEAALRSFYGALAKGDVKTAQAAVRANEPEIKWLEAQAELNSAFAAFGKAAVERFGDDGRSLQQPVPAKTALKKTLEVMEKQRVTPKGDTLAIPVNPRFPLLLVREDQSWKVDLVESFSAPEKAGGTPLAEQTALYSAIAEDLSEVASGIEEGRFATVDDIRAELRRQRQERAKKSARE